MHTLSTLSEIRLECSKHIIGKSLSAELLAEQYLIGDVDLRSLIQKKCYNTIVTLTGRLVQRSGPILKQFEGIKLKR